MESILWYINLLKMPPPIFVLGVFFSIISACCIISCYQDKYFKGISSSICFNINFYAKKLVLAVIVFVILVVFIDYPVSRFCKSHYNLTMYTVFDFFSSMGEGWFIGGVIIALILIGNFFAQKNTVNVLKMMLVGVIYAGILNTVLKVIFNRERPSINLEPLHFFQFFYTFITRNIHNLDYLWYANNSFPSGHTIIVFTAISPLLLHLKELRYKILIVCFSVMVAMSRVYTLNHWLSDIFGAAVLGLLVGHATYVIHTSKFNY